MDSGRPGGRLLALAAMVAAVAIQLPIFDRWFGLLDEGYMLSLAAEIRRGQMLYRDVYVDAPFPAAFYLLAVGGWLRSRYGYGPRLLDLPYSFTFLNLAAAAGLLAYLRGAHTAGWKGRPS